MTDHFLRGRTVLVTGAASGIGRALAEELATAGAQLHLADVDGLGLERLARELAARPGAASPSSRQTHVVDVTSEASVRALAARLEGVPLDILVNCAGILAVGRFADMGAEDFEHVVAVNFLGAVRVTRALLPGLCQRERAFIVNVASAAGLVGAPSLAAYSASKFALVGFSDALGAELAPKVGVLAVCPTLVRTNLVDTASFADPGTPGAAHAVPDLRERLMALLARFGSDPRKVARAILRAVEQRRRRLLVNPDAHVLDLCHRLSPALTQALVERGYRWLTRKGTLA